jgi:hypothetical protein
MSARPSEANPSQAEPAWKQRIVDELIRYWVNVVYLAIFLGAFAWYRRFVLAEYRISYFNYGTPIIEALILAKVILIGDAMNLGRGFENRPLIYPTVYKAIIFSGFVGLFAIAEHMIGGLLHGTGVAGGLAKLWNEGKYELLARCLVTFLAFIPFFAFKELEAAVGKGSLRGLFFRRKAAGAH